MGQSINLMSRAISLTTIIIIIIIIVIIIIIIIVIIILLLLLLFYYFIIIMKFFMFYIISFLQIAYGFCIGALFKWYPGMIFDFFVCVDVHVCQFWTTTLAILVCFLKFSTSLRVNIIYLSMECVTKFWHCRWMVFMKLKSI